MKKNYSLFFAGTFALLASSVSLAQEVADTLTFEDFTLDSTGYFNGSTKADTSVLTITLGNYTLDNKFTSSDWGGYWSGYAVSNVKDSVTPGTPNQYAAYPFSGANNSAQYGIAGLFGAANIVFDTIRTLKSIQIANTTYAVQSMRNGDSFAKKFGSPNGADGNPDGTEGKDWFLLQIIPLNANDSLVGDTINYYLADYRFDDPTQNYIKEAWESVSLGDVKAKKLTFKLTSSDSGQFGMNTPAYFALDNLITAIETATTPPPAVGIQEASGFALSVYPNPASEFITIEVDKNAQIQLVDALGAIIELKEIQNSTTLDVRNLAKGIYFLSVQTEVGQRTQKITIK